MTSTFNCSRSNQNVFIKGLARWETWPNAYILCMMIFERTFKQQNSREKTFYFVEKEKKRTRFSLKIQLNTNEFSMGYNFSHASEKVVKNYKLLEQSNC